jgi:hypothetical protein
MSIRLLPVVVLGASLVVIATSSTPVQDAELSQYMAARQVYQRTVDSLVKVKFEKAIDYHRVWVTEQGPRLRQLSGRLEMPGLTDSVKLNIGSFSGNYDNDALPDGLVYRTRDSVDVFVTDTAIFGAWARSAPGYGTRGPTGDVLKDAYTFSEIFDTGAHGYQCGEVPAASRTKHVYGAMLVEYSQDQDAVCSPEWLIVSVRAGRRLIVAQQPVPESARADKARLAAMAQALVDRLPDR